MPIVLALAAVLALWIDLSPIHRFHNSDSLVPILVSLQKWTPFYWEQNRFGMLVPLLALPVGDPFGNLLFQVGLRLFALVLSFFLLARAVVPRPWWPAVGALTLGVFLVGKDVQQHNFQQMQPYFQALSLALGGLAFLEGRRGWSWTITGSILMALAFWISPTTLFWLVPLLALRRLLGIGHVEGRGIFPFLLVVGCFAASFGASRLSPSQGTHLGLASPADWPRGWLALGRNAIHYLGPWVTAGVALLLVAALLTGARQGGRGRPALAAGLCLLGTAAVELLILGTTGWVHANNFRYRFLSTVLLAVATVGAAMLLGLLLEGRPERWGRAVNALALSALLPLTLLRYGPPSPGAARAALDAHSGAAEAREVVAANCTHVLGDYWRVWPAVFHAGVLLRERGEERDVWGITFRSTPTRELWNQRDWRQARIALLGSPPQTERARAAYRIPPFEDSRGPAVCVDARSRSAP